jgi:hypothetical protein
MAFVEAEAQRVALAVAWLAMQGSKNAVCKLMRSETGKVARQTTCSTRPVRSRYRVKWWGAARVQRDGTLPCPSSATALAWAGVSSIVMPCSFFPLRRLERRFVETG